MGDDYAALFSCLTFAQRARCAAAIFRRADGLKMRTGFEAPARLVFAQRAFWASEIRRRADADSVRLGALTLAPLPV